MIDPHTINETVETDGESLFCFGEDAETGEMVWAWIPVEILEEAGRTDLLRSAGIWSDDDWEAAA
ncbi:hypothetical protein OZ671_10065 [Phreatobacter sp. AB_2022a]|nr:hypothetical protein [Phreatobacter sp. AB_2022a]MCZ0734582.1 hypothetical protein [Phreatobacter sp. AB_2022a]